MPDSVRLAAAHIDGWFRLSIAPGLVAAALFASSCMQPGGSLQLTISGPEELPAGLQAVSVDWDGETSWTREISCRFLWSYDNQELSYLVDAYDQGIENGFGLVLELQDYEGPGIYVRDEFQPTPVLSLALTEAGATQALWTIGTDSGGQCSVTVDEVSRSGQLSCSDVVVFQGTESLESRAQISGSWSCNTLGRRSGSQSTSTDYLD